MYTIYIINIYYTVIILYTLFDVSHNSLQSHLGLYAKSLIAANRSAVISL